MNQKPNDWMLNKINKIMKTIKITTFLIAIFSFGISFSQNYGYVNEQNVFVIQPKFIEARDFSEGRAAVRYKDKNGWVRWHFIGEKGEFVTNVKYWSVLDYINGYATVQYGPDHWGVIDKTERAVVTFFKANQMFSAKEEMVRFNKEGKYGFFNTNRKKIANAIYEDAQDFSNGLAAVQQNGLYGFINKMGEVAIAFKYKTVANFVNNKAKVTLGNDYYEIDSSGKETKISKEDFELSNPYQIAETNKNSQSNTINLKVCEASKGISLQKPEGNNTNYQSQATFSSSTYALDIFKEQGSIVIYKGSTMYVVKIKGKKKQDINITAAQANQLLGFTTEFKFQSFPNYDCNSLKAKYGGNFTVICQGEIDLDK